MSGLVGVAESAVNDLRSLGQRIFNRPCNADFGFSCLLINSCGNQKPAAPRRKARCLGTVGAQDHGGDVRGVRCGPTLRLALVFDPVTADNTDVFVFQRRVISHQAIENSDDHSRIPARQRSQRRDTGHRRKVGHRDLSGASNRG